MALCQALTGLGQTYRKKSNLTVFPNNLLSVYGHLRADHSKGWFDYRCKEHLV